MAQELSENFVSVDSAAAQSLKLWSSEEELEHLVRRFVRVFRANRTTIADGVAQRLENLFWRIWSSRSLLRNISKQQLERQLVRISQGGRIRTTPIASPRQPFLSSSEQGCSQEPPILVLDGSSLPPSNDDSFQEPDQAPTPTPSSPFAHLKGHKDRRSRSPNERQNESTIKSSSKGRADSSIDQASSPLPPKEPVHSNVVNGSNSEGMKVYRSTTDVQERNSTSRRRSGILTNAGGQKRKPSFIRRGSSQTSRLKVSFKPDSQKHRDDGQSRPQHTSFELRDPQFPQSRQQIQHSVKDDFAGDPGTSDEAGLGRMGSAYSENMSAIKDQRAVLDQPSDQSSRRTLLMMANKATAAAAAAASFQASGVLDIGHLAELDPEEDDEAEPLGEESTTNTAATFKRRPPAAPPPLPGRTRSQLAELLDRGRKK